MNAAAVPCHGVGGHAPPGRGLPRRRGTWPTSSVARVRRRRSPYGAEQVRQAYMPAGDTVALIVQSRKGTARTPFRSSRR